MVSDLALYHSLEIVHWIEPTTEWKTKSVNDPYTGVGSYPALSFSHRLWPWLNLSLRCLSMAAFIGGLPPCHHHHIVDFYRSYRDGPICCLWLLLWPALPSPLPLPYKIQWECSIQNGKQQMLNLWLFLGLCSLFGCLLPHSDWKISRGFTSAAVSAFLQ